MPPYLVVFYTLRPVNDATEGSTQEAPMCASQKRCLYGVSPRFCLKGMMGASCVLHSILLLHVTVYQNHYFKSKLDGNSHYFANFFRKHAGSTHGSYLRASFCCIINGSQCIFLISPIHYKFSIIKFMMNAP